MRSFKGLLILAAGLAIVGGLLFAFPSDGTIFFYGQTAGPESDIPHMPTLLYIDYRRIIGIVLMWIASLLVAGVVAVRLTRTAR